MISHIGQRVLICLLILGMRSGVRAELILANFTAANPIKIMAIGDSITDDCMALGAWRLYLQPLLETNGYPFTFVGRQQSFAVAGFTERAHEGYCGSVIAAPGVLSYSVHGYAGGDMYLQKIVADALTNTTPDLVLVMMGANDIGRGRNPWQVATNDMPNLLDLIFSNAPNANVILNKGLTLLSGNVSGLNYGAYATNVPIYNSALQTMVVQRRDLGQKVFLSDMFSTVDYGTMFLTDHVHPNALGLQTIAQEWFNRIKAITIRTNLVTSTLIHGGDIWKYSDTGEDLRTNWVGIDYDDSGWSSGRARLGYGDLSVVTTVNFGPDLTNRYPTTYYRHAFVQPDNVSITNLSFRLSRVDGAVVWLNGQEMFRTNMPTGPIAYTNWSSATTVGERAYIFYPTNLAASGLQAGTNVVAVEVHLRIPGRTMSGFDMELIGSGSLIPLPTLSITPSGNDVLLSWPLTNGSSFTLYSTTNPITAGSWIPTLATAQTNGGQIVVTQTLDTSTKFFRLQRP